MDLVNVITDGSAKQTGKLMHKWSEKYFLDMFEFAGVPFIDVYEHVKNLPYREDPLDREFLQRPMWTLNGLGDGGDCDDKSICIASYCILNKIPYKFIACRKKEEKALHHVFPIVYLDGNWIIADPTYNFNTLGHEREKFVEYVEI